jgi:hypothetical protein
MSIPDAHGVIYGCYEQANGQLRLIDSDSYTCDDSSEAAIQWNQTGPTGSPGSPGTPGPQGPHGAQGLLGATGPGWQIVEDQFTVQAGEIHHAVQQCRVGKVLLGGGVTFEQRVCQAGCRQTLSVAPPLRPLRPTICARRADEI